MESTLTTCPKNRDHLITDPYQLHIRKAPKGRGAADAWVEKQYVAELRELRRTHVATILIVIQDGDRFGLAARLRRLDDACNASGVPPRQPADKAVIVVPTWNIETWLAYLEGQDVEEGRGDYSKLARPRQCQRHVDRLVEMCRQGKLREPAPASLHTACTEYGERGK